MEQTALYEQRRRRIRSAINLEPVDRIPVIYVGYAFAPRYMGMSIAQYCADPDAAVDVTLAAMKRLGPVDGCNGVPRGRITVGLTAAWLSRLLVPGRDLPDDSLWQVREAEVMSVADYDRIIEKGWRPFVAEFLPKVIDPQEFQDGIAWGRANLGRILARFTAEGFVPVSGGTSTIPFESLCGARSMSAFFLDLYRRPDKVQAAMDVMLPDMIQTTVEGAKAAGTIGYWVGGWRSASAMVSPEIWERFVLPYFQRVVGALAENGIASILHLDQDWTRDLARLRELPAKKCILNPDGMTDIRKAKEILGDHMAIMGDVPSNLLVAGSPDDVYGYVRDLVRDVGPTGLLLCPGCDAPINAKPENMEAFVAAGHDFGAVGS